jgi:hypothetical protein
MSSLSRLKRCISIFSAGRARFLRSRFLNSQIAARLAHTSGNARLASATGPSKPAPAPTPTASRRTDDAQRRMAAEWNGARPGWRQAAGHGRMGRRTGCGTAGPQTLPSDGRAERRNAAAAQGTQQRRRRRRRRRISATNRHEHSTPR